MREKFNFLLKKGFFYIFSASLINKTVSFGISIVLVRVLSKELFGRWAYANNILSFFLLLEGLGVVSGLLQFASAAKTKEEKASYLKLAMTIGLIFNSILSLIIFSFSFIFELPVKGSIEILRWLSFVPLCSIFFGIFQVFLRTEFRNKAFSFVSTFNTITFFFGVLLGGILFEINGIIIGKYLSFIISSIIAFSLLRDYKSYRSVKLPSKKEIKEFFSFSLVAVFNNTMSSMLYLLDTFLVGIIIQSERVVASYKTATLIPFALNFIPSAVMTFAYPYFAQNHLNKQFVKRYFLKIQKYLFILNLIISIIMILFAPFIISIVFGDEYSDSILPFRILSFGFLIAATFRIPAGNVLASIKKIKVNFYNTLISGTLNIILDIFFIKQFGSVGAAIATVLVFVISSVIGNIYLYNHFRGINS